MKKIITTALLAGSFMGIFGATALFAEESQSEAIKQKAKAKGQELTKKTKAVPQIAKQGMEDKCVYSKEAINKSYEKKAKMPLRIHEFMLLSSMHF